MRTLHAASRPYQTAPLFQLMLNHNKQGWRPTPSWIRTGNCARLFDGCGARIFFGDEFYPK